MIEHGSRGARSTLRQLAGHGMGGKSACVGIDPGQSGALAVIDGERIEVTPMPRAGKGVDWHAVASWLAEYAGPSPIAYVEKVHAMPQQGVSSTFKFGVNVGGLHGVLGALEIPMRLVTPQAWKRRVLAGTDRTKAAAIEYCRQRYPHITLLATERSRKAHDGMADALCLATYGMQEPNQ